MFGICNLSIVPCRKEDSDRSELVTQLLFGDSFVILEETAKWARIRNDYDGYESFIDQKQFLRLSESAYIELQQNLQQTLSSDLISLIYTEKDKSAMAIVSGSTLPFYEHGTVRFGGKSFQFEGQPKVVTTAERDSIIENALLYQNAPYLWGGRSPFGIDCSGFSQIVYKLSGLRIKRDASEQAQEGKALSFVEEAQPGDLAFFDNEEGKIVHVGIVLPGSMIIHASGKVRIDQLDHHGIYNLEQKKYTHRLRVLKSYF